MAVGEYRALWLASAQSVVGDQLARVALSVLVFQRTNSPGWTAATYALTLLPALLSGVLLSGLADRFPRRAVMVTCDLACAAFMGLMALPWMPLPVLAVLVVLAQLAQAPFSAAQGAMLPAVLGGRYEQGQRILSITRQSGQLAGFAGGGLLVAWLGAHPSLAVNAVTFLASAVLIRLGVRNRPAAASPEPAPSPEQPSGSEPGSGLEPAPSSGLTPSSGWGAQIRAGARLIWSQPRLRALVGLAWLAGFTVVPEGLAVPFAREVGAGPAAVGLLLAADPAGMVLAAFVLGRRSTGVRLRLLGPLAICTSLPLLAFLFRPDLAGALVLLALCGACSAYQITAAATFVRLTPDRQRGQALGLASSGLTAAQGLGVAGGGLVAQLSGSATGTIAAAGAAGVLCALAAAAAWSRADPGRIATLVAVEGVSG